MRELNSLKNRLRHAKQERDLAYEKYEDADTLCQTLEEEVVELAADLDEK